MKFTKIAFGFLLAAMLSSSIFLAFAATGKYEVQLQIPLPGKETITACTEVRTGTNPDGTPIMGLNCTGLADYIVIIYQWLVAAAAILAAMMFTWGGFLWLTAGGSTGRLGQAKTIFGNALTGLALALGSYTLLAVINPGLVDFKGFDLSLIKPKQQADLVGGSLFGGSLGGRLGPIPCNPILTPASSASVTVTIPGSPTPGDPCDGTVLLQHKTENKIQFTGAGAGGCAQEARDAGIWERGIKGESAAVPSSATQNAAANATFAKVDPHIIGAINTIAEQCHGLNGRATQITALNEQCGHGAYASTNGHYGGKAVDIGNLCGDADDVCSPNQLAIVQDLIGMGYSVCTQDKFCGGNCDDDTSTTLATKKNSHFHIQWN